MITLSAAIARLQREVPEAEAAIDEAMLRVSSVMTTTLQARKDVAEKSTDGQAALLRLHKSFGDLLGAQSEMLRAHGELRKTGVEYGMPDEEYCPPKQAELDAPEIVSAA